MEWQNKLLDGLDDNLRWKKQMKGVGDPDDETNESLRDVLDELFWAGESANDGKKWTQVNVPTYRGPFDDDVFIAPNMAVKFTDGTNEYSMKLIEANNDTVKENEPLRWLTPPVRDKYYTPEWDYATMIEITKKGDQNALMVFQTYGEPHGGWDWDFWRFNNPVAINYLRFK